MQNPPAAAAAAAADAVGRTDDDSAGSSADAAAVAGVTGVSHGQLAAGDGVPVPDHTDTAASAAPQSHGHSRHQPEWLLAAAGTVLGLESACGDTSGERVGDSLVEGSHRAAAGMRSLGHFGMRGTEHASVVQHSQGGDAAAVAAAAADCDLQGTLPRFQPSLPRCFRGFNKVHRSSKGSCFHGLNKVDWMPACTCRQSLPHQKL